MLVKSAFCRARFEAGLTLAIKLKLQQMKYRISQQVSAWSVRSFCEIFNINSILQANKGNGKNVLFYKPIDIYLVLLVFDLLLSLFGISVSDSYLIVF